MHDEISGWVSTEGEEKPGLLETRWLSFDDSLTGGTGWIDEKGITQNMRKGGKINILTITNDEYYTLLPEYYLRPFSPHYITEKDFKNEIRKIELEIKELFNNSLNDEPLVNERKTNKLKHFQAKEIPIIEVIDYISGNSGLTEEVIYKTLDHEGKRYEVLSSATEDRTQMGEIPYCEIKGKPLKTYEGKNGLLVARNGKAGTTRYLHEGRYTINDHAYILYVKDECPYEINLKWLSINYRSDFLAYSSSSDNGTWNMTGFFKSLKIDIPIIEEQYRIVALWEKIEKRTELILQLQKAYNELLSKEICD